MAANAILAGRGEWVTNEQRLVDRAGLRGIDAILAEREPRILVEQAMDFLVESARERAGV